MGGMEIGFALAKSSRIIEIPRKSKSLLDSIHDPRRLHGVCAGSCEMKA